MKSRGAVDANLALDRLHLSGARHHDDGLGIANAMERQRMAQDHAGMASISTGVPIMSSIVRAILYRIFDQHRDEANVARQQNERAVVALEKIAAQYTEKDQSK